MVRLHLVIVGVAAAAASITLWTLKSSSDSLSLYLSHRESWSDVRVKEAAKVDEPIGKAAIFYNIFTAPGKSTATLEIVEEQLTTWRASNVANATLYYSLLEEKRSKCHARATRNARYFYIKKKRMNSTHCKSCTNTAQIILKTR
jgi:hypothetical protein